MTMEDRIRGIIKSIAEAEKMLSDIKKQMDALINYLDDERTQAYHEGYEDGKFDPQRMGD